MPQNALMRLSAAALLLFCLLVSSSRAQKTHAAKVDEKKLNLLFDAVKNGDKAAIDQALKAGAGINDRLYSTTVTPLGLAISEGKVEIVRYLIGKGADMKDVHEGLNALEYALKEEKISQEIVRFFVGFEKDKTKLSEKIVYAASMNHYPLIEALVKAGVDVNFRTEADGRTALIRAAAEGWVDTVKRLLALGANREIKDNKGKTALDYALLAKKNKIWLESDYKSMGITEQGVSEIIALLRKQP